MNKRLKSFDSLRGFFVFLALYEHFNYFFNFLIPYYLLGFSRSSLIFPDTVSPTMQMPMDMMSTWFMKIFGAWVPQVYIAMALFNFGLKSRELTKEKMLKNAKWLGFLFIAFTIENILIAKNLGQMLSPNALMIWMLILLFFNFSSYYLGFVKTVMLALIYGSFNFIPAWQKFFLDLQTSYSMTNDSILDLACRPEVFLYAATIGHILGYVYKKISEHHFLILMGGSFLLSMIFLQLAPTYHVDRFDIFLHEYDWSFDILGSITIWLVIIFVLSFASWMEKKGKGFSWWGFSLVGQKSLGYFLLHKIYFLYVFIPLYLFVMQKLQWKISNSTAIIWFAILLYSLLYFQGILKIKQRLFQKIDP